MEKTLDNARKYEETGKEAYNPKDRPAFHLTPFIGWMNDPNGFSFYTIHRLDERPERFFIL